MFNQAAKIIDVPLKLEANNGRINDIKTLYSEEIIYLNEKILYPNQQEKIKSSS